MVKIQITQQKALDGFKGVLFVVEFSGGIYKKVLFNAPSIIRFKDKRFFTTEEIVDLMNGNEIKVHIIPAGNEGLLNIFPDEETISANLMEAVKEKYVGSFVEYLKKPKSLYQVKDVDTDYRLLLLDMKVDPDADADIELEEVPFNEVRIINNKYVNELMEALTDLDDVASFARQPKVMIERNGQLARVIAYNKLTEEVTVVPIGTPLHGESMIEPQKMNIKDIVLVTQDEEALE